jgi:hypothetical protein
LNNGHGFIGQHQRQSDEINEKHETEQQPGTLSQRLEV